MKRSKAKLLQDFKLEFSSKTKFATKAEAEEDAIRLAKSAIDYRKVHGEWPLWAKGGLNESKN